MDFQFSLDLCRHIRDKWNSAKNKKVDKLHLPISEDLAIDLCSGYNNNTKFALFDAGCILAITLIGMGHEPSNIYVVESPEFDYHYSIAKDLSTKLGFSIIEYPLLQKPDFNMNFTATLGNPPYSGQLHLEFLLKCLEISDEVKLIHPSGWLTRSDRSIEKDVKNALDGRVKSLKIFNGVPVFNAEFQAPLVITEAVKSWDGPVTVTYDNTGNTYEIDSIWDFPTGYWEPTEINLTLRDLIFSEAKKSNLLSLRTSNINSVPLNLPTICGHPVVNDSKKLFGDDFHTFFYHNSNIYTHENNEGRFYSLKSEEERDNLVSYLKTKFARFALALNKATNRNNVIRYIENVPLPPLDVEWTDESVYEYYGLSSEQIDSIESFIPTYYK